MSGSFDEINQIDIAKYGHLMKVLSLSESSSDTNPRNPLWFCLGFLRYHKRYFHLPLLIWVRVTGQ